MTVAVEFEDGFESRDIDSDMTILDAKIYSSSTGRPGKVALVRNA